MNSTHPHPPHSIQKRMLTIPRPVGCCAGQAAGCGCSFLASWVVALLLTSIFGRPQGGNLMTNLLLPAIIFAGSLVMAAVFSFLTGRFFPVFQKKAG